MGARIKILMASIVITITTTIFSFSTVSTPASTPNTSSADIIIQKYYLKDFNGKVAIYEKGQDFPIEVLDVELSSLPERDIEKIKNGIFADSLNEIYLIAEDYE